MKIQIDKIKPEHFEPDLEVVTIFLEVDEKFLILKRAAADEIGRWCFSGGKIKQSETAEEALLREVLEETGIFLPPQDIQHVDLFYVEKSNIKFILHVFHISLSIQPKILLNEEHNEYKWLAIDDLLGLPLIASGKTVISSFVEKMYKQ